MVEKTDPSRSEKQTINGLEIRPASIGKTDLKKTNRSQNNKSQTERNETKDTYGAFSNVRLSKMEYASLQKEFPRDYGERIEALSEYIAASGRRYKNHLAVIRSWYRREQKNCTVSRHQEQYETEECL